MTSRKRAGGHLIRCGLIAMAMVLLPTPAASAHTELASSSPAEGARLDQAPDVIALTFNEPVSARMATLTLSVEGRELGQLDLTQEAPDTLAGKVEPEQLEGLTGHTWRVSYRVAGKDGHPVTGAVSFKVVVIDPHTTATGTVGTSPSASPIAPTSGPTTEPRPSTTKGSTQSTIMLGLITLVGVAIGCALLIRARRRSRDP